MQASQALSQCSHPGYAQFPQQGVLAAYGKCSLPGQPVKDLVPRALPGISHVGSLCLEHTHIPEPPEESRGSPWIDSRHSEPFLLVRGGDPPEIQVPRYQPRAHLVSSPLSKPAVLTFSARGVKVILLFVFVLLLWSLCCLPLKNCLP